MQTLADLTQAYSFFLFIGPSGSGKTTFATRFPNPCLIDVDRNLTGPIKMIKREGRDLAKIKVEHIHLNDKKEVIPIQDRAFRLGQILDRITLDPTIETIILDSTTSMEPVFKAEVCRQRKDPIDKLMEGFNMWESFSALWTNLIVKLNDVPKTKIFIGHEQVEQDVMDAIKRYVYAMPGKMQDRIPILVSDVWHFSVEQTKTIPIIDKYIINTVQSAVRRNYKAGLDVPSQFEATQAWADKIIAQLRR